MVDRLIQREPAASHRAAGVRHRACGTRQGLLNEPLGALLDLPNALRRPGTPAKSPPPACIGGVMFDGLPHDAENVASVRRVIWLRDAIALPIDP